MPNVRIFSLIFRRFIFYRQIVSLVRQNSLEIPFKLQEKSFLFSLEVATTATIAFKRGIFQAYHKNK